MKEHSKENPPDIGKHQYLEISEYFYDEKETLLII